MPTKQHKADETYPAFPGESEEIKVLRRTIQKPFSREDFVTFYFLRPVSIYVSLAITRYTRLSANQITYTMAFLAFLAPIIVFFQTSLGATIWSGTVFYHLIFMLDMIDGEVARLRKTVSKRGEIVDAMLWFLFPALYGVYTAKIMCFLGWDMLTIALLMTMVSSVMSDMLQKLYPPKSNISKYIPEEISVKGRAQYMVRYVLSQGGIYLIAPIWYLFGWSAKMLLIYWVITLFLYFLYAFLRLKNTLSSAED